MSSSNLSQTKNGIAHHLNLSKILSSAVFELIIDDYPLLLGIIFF